MSTPELTVQPSLPSISFDTHFANVSHIEEVRFDAARCASLLTHPKIGISPNDLHRIHIYVRPDYELAYTDVERSALQNANPEDYDDAASTEMLSEEGPFGQRGDILITLVYRSGFGLNKLLGHEAVHARVMLQQNILTRWRDSLTSILLPAIYARNEAAEEAEADRAMEDLTLKGLRKNVIEVIRNKKRSRNLP
jgi:hypothetical protein